MCMPSFKLLKDKEVQSLIMMSRFKWQTTNTLLKSYVASNLVWFMVILIHRFAPKELVTTYSIIYYYRLTYH